VTPRIVLLPGDGIGPEIMAAATQLLAAIGGVMEAGNASIDLGAQTVAWSGGEASFDIDPELKRRLSEGLDDIGVTLQQQDAIDRFEAERERQGPVTTNLA
jgi:3-isopropylmalate/(R)-2-methylmalate dehydratase small subunit